MDRFLNFSILINQLLEFTLKYCVSIENEYQHFVYLSIEMKLRILVSIYT